MRLMLIGCALLVREISDAILHSPHLVDIQLLPAGLHDVGAKTMRGRIQDTIDNVDGSRYDAIVLGYALCGTGLAGIHTRATPLVVPRAHDCITLLMGSRERYRNAFARNPGVYYRSAGWVERHEEMSQQFTGIAMAESLDALIERYGEESGKYLHEEFTRYRKTYSQLTFIRTGLEPDDSFDKRARAEAAEKGWTYEEIKGDPTLFRRLLRGEWDHDFLVVPAGHHTIATYDDEVIASVR